jgi:hypothetical protein
MSEPHLPEDLSRWPTSPYELLGVAFGVGPRELRRAYTRLIRTYKPEQFPEHFRRIREAYELVLRHVEMFRFGESEQAVEEPAAARPTEPSAPQPPAPPTPDSPAPPAPAGPAPPGGMPRPQGANLHDELHAIWEEACSGRETSAYRKLLEVHARQLGRGEVYLRLYWLLRLTPELDSARQPLDWLLDGLHATGLAGPLRELYRRELDEEPSGVLHPRGHELLRLPVRGELLADLAEWRWLAAARLQQWKLLADDLFYLHDRLAVEDSDVWCRLLLSAVDHIVWVDSANARSWTDWCRRQIAQYAADKPSWQGMDRLEYLLELVGDWRALQSSRTGPPTLDRLVQLSWSRPFEEVRPLLMCFLRRTARQPKQVILELDLVRAQAPAVLSQLGQMLGQLEATLPYPPEETRSAQTRAQQVLDFFAGTELPSLRWDLLEFCVTEAIAPEEVAAVIASRRHWDDLAHHLFNDWPLRHVCWACRLFGT